MITASIGVESHDLSLAQIEQLIGTASGAGGHSLGDPHPAHPDGRRWSSWVRPLTWPPGTHAGTEGIAAALLALPRDLTAGLVAARDHGCSVTLSILQELHPGDVWPLGLHLPAECLAWLSTVGATLDVDQYLLGDDHAPER